MARATAESNLESSDKALEEMERNVQMVLGQLETKYNQVVNHLHDVDDLIAKLWL